MAAILLALSNACVKPYLPDVIQSPNQYLVIDGVVHPDTDTTVIRLSRSRNLADADGTILWESGAQVFVESSGGQRYRLPETGTGQYQTLLQIDPSDNYRLYVQTIDGKEYQSSFEPVMRTPQIDSIHWKQDGDLYIYADTHDETDQVKYFRWEYKEVWEYRTPYESYHYWNGSGVVYRDLDSLVSRCWDSTLSSQVIIATSDGTQGNLVRDKQITKILYPDRKLSAFYNIQVKQYGLTKGAYTYWDEIRKNGTQIGGVFDPLPSQLSTNLTCISNPEETVIGYFSIATVTKASRYISNTELDGWVSTTPDQFQACKVLESYDPFTFEFYANNPRYLIAYQDLATLEYKLALAECVDCRLSGGTTKKPGYWPR